MHQVRAVKKDSASVSKLRSCGAILIGKANMHELGLGTTGNNPNYGWLFFLNHLLLLWTIIFGYEIVEHLHFWDQYSTHWSHTYILFCEYGHCLRLAKTETSYLSITHLHNHAQVNLVIHMVFSHRITRNPYAEDRYTGGSSSGCAALVAMGLCSAALGTDGGGMRNK